MHATVAARPSIVSAKTSLSSTDALKRASAVAQRTKTRDVTVRADWSIGSTENMIVCFNTTAILGAMRFGLMPSVKKNFNGASSHTAMVEQANAKTIGSRDPSGFTAVDVLAGGSLATIISAGEILAGQVPY
ncbi:Photosystem I PsaG/PsaK protein [Ostreococcus tauri]|uniref:Photosystem I PsaG/PsaK protein n=2 Tax=Ostreococcus tauri TaxID=70448 RepID=A0A096P8E8_OSTTA|nr:Photosystem I PsaG/PsaK protein [Ostreococcus tauri]OUS45327.1 putative psaK, PSI-K, subunit X, photosystem I polypeptide [Ostreococcus tauri]7YCA_K Chain K, Photosystem I PsaG/PsaK protein [Ostreococcus tauri]CEG00525.1 Photosystem I PsaG/PsaK protein [Ostreococcus tauri]|eukprot:XP_022840425.1 Photosystem I PsaG/PsaK protein [Ostreococcus tauri]